VENTENYDVNGKDGRGHTQIYTGIEVTEWISTYRRRNFEQRLSNTKMPHRQWTRTGVIFICLSPVTYVLWLNGAP